MGVIGMELRVLLDGIGLEALSEYVAERLGLVVGERSLEWHWSDGSLRRTDIHIGPLRQRELALLDAGDQPRGLGRS